jgi:UDP-N-acetylglucosamine 2-epimerase (non-hydrolysing)
MIAEPGLAVADVATQDLTLFSFLSAVARLHFAPTEAARANLLREGVDPGQVLVVGNPVIDALLWALDQPYDLSVLGLEKFFSEPEQRLILVTAHRRESFGPPLESITDALAQIASIYGQDVLIVFPVHPNPQVHAIVHSRLAAKENILLLPPVDYVPLAHLLRRSDLVLTDSGGLQEEAPALGKPVLVLRALTERPEVVDLGLARIVGTNQVHIVDEVRRLLDDSAAYGRAAGRIVAALLGENIDSFEPGNSPDSAPSV